jgi:hypothetical protein
LTVVEEAAEEETFAVVTAVGAAEREEDAGAVSRDIFAFNAFGESVAWCFLPAHCFGGFGRAQLRLDGTRVRLV